MLNTGIIIDSNFQTKDGEKMIRIYDPNLKKSNVFIPISYITDITQIEEVSNVFFNIKNRKNTSFLALFILSHLGKNIKEVKILMIYIISSFLKVEYPIDIIYGTQINKFIKNIEQGPNGETLFDEAGIEEIIFSQNFINGFINYVFENQNYINSKTFKEVKEDISISLIEYINEPLKLLLLYLLI